MPYFLSDRDKYPKPIIKRILSDSRVCALIVFYLSRDCKILAAFFAK